MKWNWGFINEVRLQQNKIGIPRSGGDYKHYSPCKKRCEFEV